MNCGRKLKWYELVPVFSFLIQGGKCRGCKTKISFQYPIIELLNGILYILVYFRFGISIEMGLISLLTSALIVITVIDWRTFEIPLGCNIFILVLGIIRVLLDLPHASKYVIGFFAISVVLYLLFYFSKGRAIGGGDIKLMAAAGLLIGFPNILLAFFLGCVLGSVIHITRMKITGAEHKLAFGPYLSAGILIAALYGDQIVNWYLSFYM